MFSVDQAKFASVFHGLVENVTTHFATNGASHEVISHVEKCFLENSMNGKGFRALAVPQTGLSVLSRPLTEQELQDLSVLGWLVEILQAYLLMHDDIMDGSLTRRGKPCWYRRASVGMAAINDGNLLKSSIFFLLKTTFQKHPNYLKMVEALQELTFLTEIGQECDGIASDRESIAHWTMAQYEDICRLKSGYQSFYLSVLLALYYLQLDTPLNIQQTQDVLISLGSFYQFQNDYLDVFGDHRFTGKVGTDIQEGKCSWLIIRALQTCSEAQRHVLLEHYGESVQDSALKCQQIFEELSLQEFYKAEETRLFSNLEDKVRNLDRSDGLGSDIFNILLRSVRGVAQKAVGEPGLGGGEAGEGVSSV